MQAAGTRAGRGEVNVNVAQWSAGVTPPRPGVAEQAGETPPRPSNLTRRR